MNYFYTYVEDEQEVSSLQQIQTEMQRKNAAVCFFDYGSTAQWEQLQAVWKISCTFRILHTLPVRYRS